jgi:hypothetical protein
VHGGGARRPWRRLTGAPATRPRPQAGAATLKAIVSRGQAAVVKSNAWALGGDRLAGRHHLRGRPPARTKAFGHSPAGSLRRGLSTAGNLLLWTAQGEGRPGYVAAIHRCRSVHDRRGVRLRRRCRRCALGVCCSNPTGRRANAAMAVISARFGKERPWILAC